MLLLHKMHHNLQTLTFKARLLIICRYTPGKTNMEPENNYTPGKGKSSKPNRHFQVSAVNFQGITVYHPAIWGLFHKPFIRIPLKQPFSGSILILGGVNRQ